MCTYVTEKTAAVGSGKGTGGWFPLESLTVYYDHPVHALAAHTMNLDFANPSRGAGARVAVELTTETAVELVRAVATVLAQVPEDLSGVDPQQAARLAEAAKDLLPRDLPVESR